MDTIFLNGYKVSGTHGVLPRERNVEQEFEISIAASCDARTAAASDDLADAVDYVPFCDAIDRVMKGESCYLIERLAERIAADILSDKKINTISVTIRKPAALENGTPGITIVRARA